MNFRLLSAFLIALSLITVAVPVYAGFFDFLSPQQNFLIIEDGLVDENSFLDLNDTPDSYSGQAGQFLKVNAGETSLIFTPEPAGGGGFDGNAASICDGNTALTGEGLCVTITGFDIQGVGGGANLLRTYTGISPIFINNDSNVIALNIQPNSDWNGLFDGNNSTFYIDWQNHVNRLFSLIELDNNSSFDARYNLTSDTNNPGRIDFPTIANPDLNEFEDPNMFWTAPDSVHPEFPHGFSKDGGFLEIDSVGIFGGDNDFGLILDWFGPNETQINVHGDAPTGRLITLPPGDGVLASLEVPNQRFIRDVNFGGAAGGSIIVEKDINSPPGGRRCFGSVCISSWADVNGSVSGASIDTNAWTEGFLESDTNAILQDVNASKKLTVDGNALFNSYVDANGFGTGDVLSEDYDLRVGIAGAGGGGCIKIGDYEICDTGNMGSIGDLSLDNYMIFRDMDGDSNISFMFITPGTLPRFVIPREGTDFATNNFRSFILGGDLGQAQDDDIIKCSANGYDKIDCDTNATGADLGVQDDAQIRGSLFVDENITAPRIDVADLNAQDATFTTKGLVNINPRYLDVNEGELNFDTNTQDLLHFFDGTILETIDVDVNSNGTDVNVFIGKKEGGDLTLVFNDGYFIFDTTPLQTITLTAGSDVNPTLNYVFIPNSTQTLTANTTGFPTDAEFAPVATILVQSAAGVVVDGAYKVHVWVDHSDDEDTHQGHESHVNSWIRSRPAGWEDGIVQTLTITTNASLPDNVDFAVTSGNVLQLHLHAFPTFDTASDSNIFVVNDSGAAFTKINDLNALLTDSAGGSMSNRYFTLVVWGGVSEDSSDSKLMINLPSGSYNKQSDATADVSGFANFTIPVDFRGTGFLISKLVLRHQPASGGTWTSIEEGDLRGLFPSVAAAGGSGSVTTEFPDNLFSLFDETDVTKKLVWQLETIPTATTIIWTASTRDQNFDSPIFVDVNVLNDANFFRLEADNIFGNFLGTFEGLAGSSYFLVDGTRTITGNTEINSASNPTLTITDSTTPVSFFALSNDTFSAIGTTTNHPLVVAPNNTTLLTMTDGMLTMDGSKGIEWRDSGLFCFSPVDGTLQCSADTILDFVAPQIILNGVTYTPELDVADANITDANITNTLTVKHINQSGDYNNFEGKVSTSDFNASGVLINETDKNVFIPLGVNVCFDQDAVHGNGNDCDTAIQNTGTGLIIRG